MATKARPVSRLAQQASAAAEAQANADALLHKSFDQGLDADGNAKQFDYSQSATVDGRKPWEAVDAMAYLARMQRGGLTQPHGVMITVEPHSSRLNIVCYSNNTAELFDLPDKETVSLGADARLVFDDSSAGLLLHEAGQREPRKPLNVKLRHSGVGYYAILNRCEMGVIMDFEPVFPAIQDLTVSCAPTLPTPGPDAMPWSLAQARHPAAMAAARLKSIPSGNIVGMCEAVVKEMCELTGYDRVMVYKFHADQHGEVLAESVREEMEPYLGLHFPSTDVPQAMRALFIRVGCRMISNAGRPMVKVTQIEEVDIGVNLSDSTLRAPHGCHAQYMVNMGTVASLTMAVLVDDKLDDLDPGEKSTGKKKLWGLVVCHHIEPRYTPYPLRKACEHLMQAFSTRLNLEVELAANSHEEDILRTHTRLCDMLEHDVPLGIVKEQPNMMDLVKCDGAALFFNNRYWLLGVAPTEKQLREIMDWMVVSHKKKNALCTESLAEAGFPGAAGLGQMVCGMVATRIRMQDWVFWFRSHAASEVRWGGRKQAEGEVDDGRRSAPRASFKAFLDVVRKSSVVWADVELEAINGLQIMLREAVEKTPSEQIERSLNSAQFRGTMLQESMEEGAPKNLRIRLAHELPATLPEPVEDVLRCFKASFIVADATREDFPIVFASEAFCQSTGYSKSEAIGKGVSLLHGPDTDESEMMRFRTLQESGGMYNGRMMHYKADGTAFWNLMTLAVVKDAQGVVRWHVVLMQELAKVTESHATSPHSPNLNSGMPVSLIRYDGRHKEKALRKVLELVQAIKRPDKAKVNGPLTPGRHGGIATELQVPVVVAPPQPSRRRRSLVERVLNIQPKEELQPEVPEVVGELRLNADRLPDEGEESLDGGRKRRAHRGIDFATTLERIEHSFIVTDARLEENPVTYVSDEYIRLTEYPREELIGDGLLVPEGTDTSMTDVRKIRSCAATHKDLALQLQCYRKNGKPFWSAFLLSCVKDGDGEVLYVVNLVVQTGMQRLSEEEFVHFVGKAKEAAYTVGQALLELPDQQQVAKQWTVHSRVVTSRPHKMEDAGWAAIKTMQGSQGRLGLKHFRPIKPLGNGDSGSVVLVELRGTKQLFAMKTMEKETMLERNKVHRVATEREILERLDHPFLPTLYGSFQTAKHVCFVTDFCQGGELYDLLEAQPEQRFEEATARFYAAEILLALEYLHCQGVIYRDLKPENVLLTKEGHVLLTDFDLSLQTTSFPKVVREGRKKGSRGSKGRKSKGRNKLANGEEVPKFVAEPLTRSNSFVGTEEYIAPEIVTGSGHTAAVDWWAFGIFLYEMLYGGTPFCGNSMRRTFANVLSKNIVFPETPAVSEEAKDLIRRLLHRKTEQRLGSQMGAEEIKSHPFFQSLNWALIRGRAIPVPTVPPKMTEAYPANEDGAVDDLVALDSWRLGTAGPDRLGGGDSRSSGVFSIADTFNVTSEEA